MAKVITGRVFYQGQEVEGQMPEEWQRTASENIGVSMSGYYASHPEEYEEYMNRRRSTNAV